MAEFCLDCWNKINETNDPASEYIISEELSLCEECNEYKHVIVRKRKSYYMDKFELVIFPFRVIYMILYIFTRIIISPYLIYKHKKHKNK